MVRQRGNVGVARGVPLFIGLVAVYGVLAVIARVVFSGNAIVQILLLSLGSGVLGSGIAYFLIRLEQHRNTRASIVGMFIALALAFVALILVALLLFASNMFASMLLLTTGAAIFAGGLTFFLIKLA
jgi:hypothetical protein